MASPSLPASGPQRGFQDPNSSQGFYNQVSLLVAKLLGKTGTMMPVQVVGTTASGLVAPPGTVTVVPQINQIDGGGNPTPHGKIFNVPIWRLQGGNAAIILDPVVGDLGMAFIAMRDISIFKSTKAQSNPGSFRRYDLADSIYVGAILGAAPTRYIRFIHGGGMEVVDAGGVTINGVVIDTYGNVQAPGEITRGAGTGDSVTLGGHVHNQPNDSHGDTEEPTDAPTAGT